jgi:peroxiredoxin Q/BCP
MLKEKDVAPEFCLKNQTNENICLRTHLGSWVVVYFYPKDNTSGCTREAVDFTEHLKEFDHKNTVIFGISPDSVDSHLKFVNKHNLKLQLLSDPGHQVLEKYGVWQEKSLYGKKFFGVVRTTFLISPTGRIEKIWRKVKVDGHAVQVLCQLQEFQD